MITVDKVDFLLGSLGTPLAFAAASVAERYHMVFVNWGSATDYINMQGYKYIVTTWTQASYYHAITLEFLRSVDPEAKRIAIIYINDGLGKSIAEGIKRKAKELGFTIVFDTSFPTDIKDFTLILIQLRLANPDAILAATYIIDGLLLSKRLADLKIMQILES